MEIKSKFSINDLLTHKYERRGEKKVTALEVINIITETCSAGTQIFYVCRPLVASNLAYTGEPKWHVSFGILRSESTDMAIVKLREDELIAATEEISNIIINASPLNQ